MMLKFHMKLWYGNAQQINEDGVYGKHNLVINYARFIPFNKNCPKNFSFCWLNYLESIVYLSCYFVFVLCCTTELWPIYICYRCSAWNLIIINYYFVSENIFQFQHGSPLKKGRGKIYLICNIDINEEAFYFANQDVL